MIVSDGYSIEFNTNRNQIVIMIPQTMQTLTSTVTDTSNMRIYRSIMTDEEMVLVLMVVKYIMERKEE